MFIFRLLIAITPLAYLALNILSGRNMVVYERNANLFSMTLIVIALSTLGIFCAKKTKSEAIRYIIGAILGWAIAIELVCLIFGETPTEELYWKSVLFLSLAPGAIIGLMVTYSLNKNKAIKNNPKSISKSINEQLLDLKALLDSGVLTQEEFNSQKNRILGNRDNNMPSSKPQNNNTNSESSNQSISDKLIELKNLLDANAISKEEYERIKQSLVEKL